MLNTCLQPSNGSLEAGIGRQRVHGLLQLFGGYFGRGRWVGETRRGEEEGNVILTFPSVMMSSDRFICRKRLVRKQSRTVLCAECSVLFSGSAADPSAQPFPSCAVIVHCLHSGTKISKVSWRAGFCSCENFQQMRSIFSFASLTVKSTECFLQLENQSSVLMLNFPSCKVCLLNHISRENSTPGVGAQLS